MNCILLILILTAFILTLKIDNMEKLVDFLYLVFSLISIIYFWIILAKQSTEIKELKEKINKLTERMLR